MVKYCAVFMCTASTLVCSVGLCFRHTAVLVWWRISLSWGLLHRKTPPGSERKSWLCIRERNYCVRLKTCGHWGRHITKYAAKLKQVCKGPELTKFYHPSSELSPCHTIIFIPFLYLINFPEAFAFESDNVGTKGQSVGSRRNRFSRDLKLWPLPKQANLRRLGILCPYSVNTTHLKRILCLYSR
jgi:hypothetical protein